MPWMFKVLTEKDGEPSWYIPKMRFDTTADAATAAAAYLRAEADNGNLMLVALEPAPETVDRDQQHAAMLNYLKQEFTRAGEMHLWEFIHSIDPKWPNPWWPDPDDPDGKCICPPIGINISCPIHGDKGG